MPRAAIVTGGHGFLGQALVARLRHQGMTVFAPPRAELDLSDAARTRTAFAGMTADTVFHLASAGVAATDADDEALVAGELAMIRNVVAAMPAGARLIYAGSMAEYGVAGRHRETDRCTPRNAYALAKMAGGELAARLAAERGIPAGRVRLYGLYGPGESSRRLLPALQAALAAGVPVPLSDGLQRRDFLHIADAAEALADLSELAGALPALLNLGTGVAVAVRDVALRLAAELGADPALLRFGARVRSPHDQDMLEADTTLLVRTLGKIPPQRLDGREPILPLLGGVAAAVPEDAR